MFGVTCNIALHTQFRDGILANSIIFGSGDRGILWGREINGFFGGRDQGILWGETKGFFGILNLDNKDGVLYTTLLDYIFQFS